MGSDPETELSSGQTAESSSATTRTTPGIDFATFRFGRKVFGMNFFITKIDELSSKSS
jgi:hypothetical protein